jgi:translation initiation factor IF-2
MAKTIGKVVHWYDKIGVAVVALAGSLKVGDTVLLKHGEREFTDTVSSMQLDHKPISSGKKGQEVAIKLSERAAEGSEVCLKD